MRRLTLGSAPTSQVFCGRYVNEHMVTHGAVAEHPVVLSFSDLSVWCYLCEAYVHNQVTVQNTNYKSQNRNYKSEISCKTTNATLATTQKR